MQAEESLKDGDLEQTLADLQEQVRSNPAKTDLRVFLFQLLSIRGEWGRALTQLEVAGDLDAGTLAMVQTYREALRCEALRSDVFQGKRAPLIFGEPDKAVALILQALTVTAEGNASQAQALREEAYESIKTSSGIADGQAFEWIADADSRIGPYLEVILNGNYYWIPFYCIQRIQFEAPEDLRDFVWMPGQFTWANGGQAVGLIPTRYPGSESCGDSDLQLARKTEWSTVGAEEYCGIGQRILATDEGDLSLMDVRDIVLNNKSEPVEENWAEVASQGNQE